MECLWEARWHSSTGICEAHIILWFPQDHWPEGGHVILSWQTGADSPSPSPRTRDPPGPGLLTRWGSFSCCWSKNPATARTPSPESRPASHRPGPGPSICGTPHWGARTGPHKHTAPTTPLCAATTQRALRSGLRARPRHSLTERTLRMCNTLLRGRESDTQGGNVVGVFSHREEGCSIWGVVICSQRSPYPFIYMKLCYWPCPAPLSYFILYKWISVCIQIQSAVSSPSEDPIHTSEFFCAFLWDFLLKCKKIK